MEILEVSLASNDISGSKSFYEDLLGLKIQFQSQSSLSMIAGQTKLSFNHMPGIEPIYHFAFNVPGNHLNEILKYLQQNVEIMPASEDGGLIADFKSWNAKSFYFNDNNGNILECIARFDLNDRSTKWNSRSFILNISEIGIVVQNVREAQELLQNCGIPLFSKGPQTPDFSVLGDDNGLIILKDTKHGWMPSNLTPEPFPTRVLLSHAEKLFELTLSKETLELQTEENPTRSSHL